MNEIDKGHRKWFVVGKYNDNRGKMLSVNGHIDALVACFVIMLVNHAHEASGFYFISVPC